MPFKTLYNRRQAEAERLPLSWYVDDANELSWAFNSIQIKRTTALPKSHLRGMIINHPPGFMPLSEPSPYTIFIAAGLTPEMERFVLIKELMHVYFGPGGTYATDSQVTLENHMQEMFANSADIKSHQYEAEKLALWMAISVLTPETNREAFRDNVASATMSFEDVAAQLRIPVHTAKALLSEQYRSEISNILE
ncbi:MAG: hypothetical protein DI637_02895 [Citromicrobium sp.]|nr:MAG: hypothetical protein DI637_02895 [Citromicrobium sp.]